MKNVCLSVVLFLLLAVVLAGATDAGNLVVRTVDDNLVIIHPDSSQEQISSEAGSAVISPDDRALALTALALTCTAQNTPPASSDSSAQSQSQNASKPATDPAAVHPPEKDKADAQTSGRGRVPGTSNDRLFYTLPNFLTLENKKQLPPMSVGDKFKVVALGTFDYVEYPWWGILAAISQATNGEPALGQGWTAYAKRYGTTAGDSMVENFMVGAVFPSILRQDPRYYQSGQGSFLRRTGYSMSRIFVTRTDSDRAQFNYSEIFGAATAAAISTYTYHPRSAYISTPSNPHMFVASDRTFSNVVNTWGTQVGLDTITIVVKEFWPDIHHKLSKKHRGAIDTEAQASLP